MNTPNPVWEISNPSDYYTISHPNFKAAALATLLLGRGGYGLVPWSGSNEEMPIFLFGGHDEWWSEHWPGETVETAVGDPALMAQVANALDSVMLGNPETFAASGMTRDDWLEKHRTSMNNIGRRAWKMATMLRARKVEP